MQTYIRTCKMYASLCHAVVIVFNLGSKRTFFNSINRWLQMLQTIGASSNIFLVGNKCDLLSSKRMVPLREVLKTSQQANIPYCETSAYKVQ